MPSVLDTAKEATYAAVGLQILALDEMNERFADQRSQLEERFSGQRSQLDEQIELARKHGADARERVQPMIQRSWEFAESTVTRVAEMTRPPSTATSPTASPRSARSPVSRLPKRPPPRRLRPRRLPQRSDR